MTAVNSQTDNNLTLFYNTFFNNVEESHLRRYYNEFLTEAFDFYWMNAKSWKDNEHDPLYDLLENTKFRYFRMPVREAVLTAAYILRRQFRIYFNQEICRLGYVDSFLTSVRCYELRKDGYSTDFVFWIAYLFELNLFCKIKKFDFEKICKPRFRNYLSFYSFKTSALYGLDIVSGPLFTYFFLLEHAFKGKYPSCDIFLPFYFAKRTVDRESKYISMGEHFEFLHNFSGNINENLSKLHALASYEPKRIIQGYIVRRKIFSQEESKATSCEKPETVIKLLLVEGTRDCTKDTLDASSEKLKPKRKYPLEFDDSKSFFALSKRLLSKRLKARFNSCESKYKRDIKLYSTIRRNMVLIEDMMNTLDESIKDNNLYKITDRLFAVYPSKCNFNIGEKIVILDTSSDDDDDDKLDPDQLVFMRNLIPQLQKRIECMALAEEHLKVVFKLPENFNFSVQSKTSSDEEKEVNTKIKGVVGKEKESAEQNLGMRKKKIRKRKKKQQEKISIESTKEKTPEKISIEGTKEKTPEDLSIDGTKEKTPEKISIEGAKEKTPEKISIESKKEKTPEKTSIESKKEETPEKISIEGTKEKTPEDLSIEGTKEKTPEKISIEGTKEKTPEKISIESTKEKTPEKISIEDMIEKLSMEGAKEKTPEKISIKSTKEKTSKKKLVLPNFEPCTIAGLRERNREILAMKNTGADWDSIRQANHYIRASLEYIIGKNSPVLNMHKTEFECRMTTKSLSANTHQKEISLEREEAKERKSTGQNLQKSDTVILNYCQGDNSVGNTGAIPKTFKPKKKYKNSSKQSSEKSKRASETIRPPTEDELVMNKTLKQLEKLKLDETKREE